MINKLKKERLYYLDALRSFLILLVALMHSSQVYNSSQTWLIYSENNSIIINYLVSLLGLLCMPTFFMIAGYFAVISFRHSHGKNFLLKRISRLLIPLVFIAFTLNILQAYILTSSGWKDYTISTYFSNGDWIQHLWFLINLIAYTLTAYLFIKYFKIQTKKYLLYISDKIKSYSIHLLHHIIVIIIGIFIINLDLSIWIGISILFISSVTISYIVHRKLILNSNILQHLINGQKK
jgi:peptidoglycan/LPS O-acetylase OafA/YrhL